MHEWGLYPFKPLKKERNRVLIPHSYVDRVRYQFYNEVREFNASLVPWLRAEYKHLSDAEEAFHNYQKSKQPKYRKTKTKNPSLLYQFGFRQK